MRTLHPRFLFTVLALQLGCDPADNTPDATGEAQISRAPATPSLVREQGFDPDGTSLSALVEEADLIFEGTLETMEYKNSSEGLPHTFATYRVNQVISGNYESDVITLRFIGGFQEGSRTRRLIVSNSPRLEIGERSVLMVRGNGDVSCPLSNCEQGRFRIEGNKVFDATQSLLASDKSGRISHIQESNPMLAAGNLAAIPSKTFVAHIRAMDTEQRASGLKLASAVSSANITRAFDGPDLRGAPAPADVARDKGPKQNQAKDSDQLVGDFDRWEEEQLRGNGGNPVLRDRFGAASE